MDNTYGEFEGTELDPSTDFDLEDDQNDLITILSLSAVVAALVGGLLVLIGRRRKPTPQERAEELFSDMRKKGGKGVKAASKAVGDAHLGDLLQEAIGRAYDAAGNVEVGDVISEVGKKARKATKDVDLSSMLDDALDRARQAAGKIDIDLEDTAKGARKQVARMADAASNVRDGNLDTKGIEGVLDTLKQRLADAIDSVRTDIAPGAADRLKSDVFPAAQGVAETLTRKVREDVMPAAQDAAEKVRDNVLPGVQERAGKMADDFEVGPRARKAADAARHGAGSLAEVLSGVAMAVMGKVVEEVLPGARKMGGAAVRAAREDVMPAAAQTAGDTVQRVREDVLPRVGDVASQAPDVLSTALRVALNKVEDAMDKAQPVASDALTYGRHRAREAAEFSLNRAHDVRNAGSGAGGALSSAGRSVTGAVGGAVGATAHVTKETTGILFWLSMLGSLILLAFVPDRDKQREIWHSLFQFIGEIRDMWDDLQGVEASEPDAE